MAKDPAFLFYPGDWLGGTMTFSRAHKGAYMDLLMCQFNQGHMSHHDIKTILGSDYETMWESKLKSKFVIDENGFFYNQKLENEILKRKKYTDSRRKNLNKTSSHMTPHMTSHMENGNGNINENRIKNLNSENFNFENYKNMVTIPERLRNESWFMESWKKRIEILYNHDQKCPRRERKLEPSFLETSLRLMLSSSDPKRLIEFHNDRHWIHLDEERMNKSNGQQQTKILKRNYEERK